MFLGLLTPKRPPPDKHCGILTEGKSVYFLTLSCRVLGSSLTGSLQSNSVQDRNKSRQFNLKTMATLFGNVFSGSKRDPTELVYTSALLWSNVLALSLGTVRRHGQLLRTSFIYTRLAANLKQIALAVNNASEIRAQG